MAFIYTKGLDALADWETASYVWSLHDAAVANYAGYQNVTEFVADHPELTVTGYARQAVEDPVRVEQFTDNEIHYVIGDPAVTFTGLSGGEAADGLLLSLDLGDDDDSIPVALWPFNSPRPTAAGTITFTFGSTTLVRTRQSS